MLYIKPILLSAVLVSISILISGCASFDSIITTGRIAQQTDSYKPIYTQASTICNYMSLLDSNFINNDYCKKLNSRIKKINTALVVISDYGKALENISKDSKFETDDKLDLILKNSEAAKWIDFNDDTEKEIKTIFSNTSKLITNSIKRKNLKIVIKDVNSPLQDLINKILLPELSNRKEVYQKFDNQINYLITIPSNLKPDRRLIFNENHKTFSDSTFVFYNKTDMLSLKHLQSQISLDLNSIESCEKSLKALSISHQKLFDKLNKIGTKSDIEITKEIIDEITNIYTGVNKL